VYYGVTYGAFLDSFWLTRKTQNLGVIEQWSRDGRLRSTPVRIPAAAFTGIALDPFDNTLWAMRASFSGTGSQRVENYHSSGRLLSAVELHIVPGEWTGIGAEFVWVGDRK
jgi:hypothetical protein